MCYLFKVKLDQNNKDVAWRMILLFLICGLEMLAFQQGKLRPPAPSTSRPTSPKSLWETISKHYFGIIVLAVIVLSVFGTILSAVYYSSSIA